MDKAKYEKFKTLLLEAKDKILNSEAMRSREDLHVSSDDLPDEADLASNLINQQVSFNLRSRELAKLRHIEMALMRIEDGTFGHCEECDDEIESKRLANQPWTTLCITHAEEREREQQRFQNWA